MRFLHFLVLGLLPVAAMAQPAQTPTTIADPPVRVAPARRPDDLKAQIEFDLKALLATLNTLTPGVSTVDFDVPGAISGGRIGYFGLSEWRDYFAQQRDKTQYRLDKIEVETLEADTAHVQVFYSLLSPNNIAPVQGEAPKPKILTLTQDETLDLKFGVAPFYEEKRWRIVPPDAANTPLYRPLSLASIAHFGANRPETWAPLRAEVSVNNLKLCALGALQFVQDYDEQYAFQNEFWREALSPYVRDRSIFQIPGTGEFYTFNDRLSDTGLAAIPEPAQTVLLYEGENERLVFRYGGKAAVAFADGRVKLVSPDEAKALRWKP